MPEQAPEMGVQYVAGGQAGFYSGDVGKAELPSTFFRLHGYEVLVASGTFATATMAQTELDRVTSQHDKPEIEELVLVAGGPDRAGLTYPSEEQFFELIRDAGCQTSANHLRRVTLYRYSNGETSILFER
jgi:hypothetical protein